MAQVKTRADSIGMFLSGAGSDGGAQTDPDASLGNFRSSTDVAAQGFTIASPIANVQIDYVAGANGEGAGTLTAVGDDELTWEAQGDGSPGPAVTILNGQQRLFESSDPDKYLLITRTGAPALTGAATVTTADPVNNAIGFDDVDDAEASAGDENNRGIFLKNESAADVKTLEIFIGTLATQQITDSQQLPASGAGTVGTGGTFIDWPDVGYNHIKTSGGATREIVYYTSRTDAALTVPAAGRGLLGTTAAAGAVDDTADAVPGIRIASEEPSVQPTGFIQTIANEATAPTAVAFTTGIAAGDGISKATFPAGEILGLWIQRDVPAGASPTPFALHLIKRTFEAA